MLQQIRSHKHHLGSNHRLHTKGDGEDKDWLNEEVLSQKHMGRLWMEKGEESRKI